MPFGTLRIAKPLAVIKTIPKHINSMNYYRVLFSDEYSNKDGSLGIIDCKSIDIDDTIIDGMKIPKSISDELIFSFKGKSLADFQMSYFPYRILSNRFKKILLDFRAPSQKFIEIKVMKEPDLKETYHILYFEKTLKVLKKGKEFKKRGLLNPELILNKNFDFDYFVYNEYDTSCFIINEKIKEELEENSITGFDLQKLKVEFKNKFSVSKMFNRI